MHRHMANRGMTLIELMVVVGIIVLLTGIMAFFVTGRRSHNAQVDLNNELAGLFQAQRMRATSMNVATYIQISDSSIEPRIGSNSVCAAAESEQYPIRYDAAQNLNVGIDLKASGTNATYRTLDSTHSTKYIDSHGALTKLTPSLLKSNGTAAATGTGVVICFQPNGQTVFMTKSGTTIEFKDTAATASVRICNANDTPGGYILSVTSLGMISSSSDKAACTPST